MPYNDLEKARENQRERSRRYRLKKRTKKYGANAPDMRGRHDNYRKGSSHPRWNNEQILSGHGYVKIRVGIDHPLADSNGYAYEHLIVWASAGYSLPDSTELIHHKDEDKKNNRLSNLELKKRSDHSREHDLDRGRDKLGRFVGKHAAGRLLDGVEWNEFPEAK